MARVRDMILGSMLLGSGSSNAGMTIELLLNTSTYVLTANLKDKKGIVVSTSSIDLPLESTVVSGSYDNTNKKLVLTLVSGETIDILVGDLIDGLQSTIQYSTIPTASIDYLGKIIQYTGTTDSTYTNGYFYQCTADGNTYIWNNINVQPGGESPVGFINNTANATYKPSELMSQFSLTVDKWYVFKNNGYINQAETGSAKNRYISTGDMFKSMSNTGNRFFIFHGPGKNEIILDITVGSSNSAPTINAVFGTNYTPIPISYSNSSNIQYSPWLKRYLPTDNATTFIPTADSYNPSTAKYSEQMVEAVAPVYSASSTYDLGDFVSYQGKMYKCTTAISTAEVWDSTHWTETTVVDNLGGESDFPIWDNPTTFGLNFTNVDSSIKNQQWYRLKNQLYLKLASWHEGSFIVGSPNALINFSTYGGVIINPAQGSNNLSDRIIAFNAISTNRQIWQPQFSDCRSYYNHSVFESNNPYAGVKFVLDTANTEAYTPSGDYNPATKKYVDDQVGSINTVLATLTTPSNGGN